MKGNDVKNGEIGKTKDDISKSNQNKSWKLYFYAGPFLKELIIVFFVLRTFLLFI